MPTNGLRSCQKKRRGVGVQLRLYFEKKWLKQEIVRPKEIITIKNEPFSAPTQAPSQTITPDPCHENSTRNTLKGDVEHVESQDMTTTSLPTTPNQHFPVSSSTTTTNVNTSTRDASSTTKIVLQARTMTGSP